MKYLILIINFCVLNLTAQVKTDSLEIYRSPEITWTDSIHSSFKWNTIDEYKLSIDDTAALVDLEVLKSNAYQRMNFPYNYSVVNGSIEEKYYQNKVVLLNISCLYVSQNLMDSCKNLSSLSEKCTDLKEKIDFYNQKTQYLNSINKVYQNDSLVVIGLTDSSPLVPKTIEVNTLVNAEYPVIKELDEQIYYIWEGLILIDK